MSQLYYPYSQDQQKEYVRELLSQERNLQNKRKLSNALHNPKDGFVYLEDPNFRPSREYSADNHIPWGSYPKVINTKRYFDLLAKSAGGTQEARHANFDQQEYGFYTDEWQDEALRAHSAGIITSTEFPAITVTTVQTELLRNELLIAQKYNLLQITTTINTDQLWIIFPEYDDTTKAVRTGYKENDPIETAGYGAFTETRIGLEKSGVGIGFTEEYYMRQFTYPIQQFILDHIAQDFVRVKHDRLVALLSTFADVAGADWGAIGATDLRSTNRPQEQLNGIRSTIHTADRLANINTIVSRQQPYLDYELNTWTTGFLQPLTATTLDNNDVVTNPRGIPWAQRWILNEDVTANNAFIFDNRAFVMIQGPRKTTQFENNNPQQTITIQKDWFKQHLRKSGWGRELTGVSA
jgi:hypothetical protein